MSAVSETSEASSQREAQLLRRESIVEREPRNLGVMVLHHIVMRTAWIFKTESIIMPAVVDAISGAGWVRGLLPVLNRIGQSIPPMLFAERLRDSPFKRRALVITTLLMALPFYAYAALWWFVDDRRQPWMVVLFLVLYAFFFAFTGLNQLANGTVQGKLIRADRRGRVLALSGFIGSGCAMLAAWLFMKPWLEIPDGRGFVGIFLFAATGFVVSGFTALALTEPADKDVPTPTRKFGDHLVNAWDVYRHDASFRRAAHVAMLFIGGIMLFPHYRWLAAERLDSPAVDMAWWVIAQNGGVGVLALVSGMLADRYGNRLTMRLQILASAFVPSLALILAGPLAEVGREWYWIVFLCLGITPITLKSVFNYTLELVDEPDHPRYLSTMRICFALPFVFSPLAGLWIDLFPQEHRFTGVCWLFSFISLLTFIGGLMTFGMEEPRHRLVDTSTLPPLRG